MNAAITYQSPLGTIKLEANSRGLSFARFTQFAEPNPTEIDNPWLQKAKDQLDNYFQGDLKEFDLKYDLKGSEFQIKVWEALLSIPYGMKRTYKDIAREIGSPLAYQAVGNANRENRIAIFIPCHRVLGANGKMVGYAGGLERKIWLLDHESKSYQQQLF